MGNLILSIVLLFTQIISWITFVVYWPVSILINLAGLTIAFSKKRKNLIAGLLLSSPILFFPITSLLQGTVGYFLGTAEIKGHGMYEGERFNLDPIYRCHHSSSGCCTFGIEPFLEAPNNYVIHFLTKLFGPMPRSYKGPYPDKMETLKLIQSTENVIPASSFFKNNCESNGLKIEFSKKEFEDCFW
ncbi:MAG: hypothetical protein AABZ60_22820, partial [Planctomycetota bacterium]